MMYIIADLQLHSKYSRAVSPQMIIPKMYEWNLKKGIGLLATGDWTHPLWLSELKLYLEEVGTGLLRIKDTVKKNIAFNLDLAHGDPLFLLSGEVSCIYTQNGKLRRNHLLLFAPSFAVVDRINQALTKNGCNLTSDGRPILGLSSQRLCEIVWSISLEVLIIPAHAWTPWFSLYGSMSGYDSLEECFGTYSEKIYTIETGLSSDPSMNWRIPELDRKTIISCSDAHSGTKLMREATIFATPNQEFSFADLSNALQNWKGNKTKSHIAATIEFFPEEGKYHFDGHRNCQVRQTPQETKQQGTTCPVCGKPLTIGVLHRIEDLAKRSEASLQLFKKAFSDFPVLAIHSETFPHRPPYMMMVPLQEIIAKALHVGTGSKKVQAIYDQLTAHFGGEFTVLFKAPIGDIARHSSNHIAEGIEKVRKGEISIEPGYDGAYGKVKIWKEDELGNPLTKEKEQLSLL